MCGGGGGGGGGGGWGGGGVGRGHIITKLHNYIITKFPFVHFNYKYLYHYPQLDDYSKH